MDSRCSSQASSTDYELMQAQQFKENRRKKGYSIRDPEPVPPYPNNPPPSQQPRQPRHYRFSPNRWRLSSSRRRYADLTGARQQEGDYAVPSVRPHAHSNSSRNRYDGFFEGSETSDGERGEPEEYSLPNGPKETGSGCSTCCCVTRYILCFFIVALALVISLGGTGLVLYNMLARDSSSSQYNTCEAVWCPVMATMAVDTENNCTTCSEGNITCCTTEPLTTNITVSVTMLLSST